MSLLFAICLLVLPACGPDPGPVQFDTPGHMAFTVNAAFDYSSGSYSIVDLDTLDVLPDALPVFADSVAACAGGRIMVLERKGADTLTVVQPEAPFAVTAQHSLGSGANPQNLVLLPSGDAMVTLLERDYLLVVDPDTGEETARIDLAWASDADGTPEACHIAWAEDLVAVTLQRLDRTSATWDPTGPGWVVLVDPVTLEVVDADAVAPGLDAIELSHANPSPYADLGWHDGLLIVPTTGFYGALDGGVEAVDVSTMTSIATLVTEEALGGDITDVVVVTSSVGFATIGTADLEDRLVRFDPSTGEADPDPVIEGEGFTLLDLDLTQDGRLLVVDRDLDDPGLHVVDAVTGVSLGKVFVGMAPFSACLP